jgi:phospholipase/carboxylesterase
MRTEMLGGLRVRVAGGIDGEGGGDGPAVVLLHGFGASGDDLVPLWRMLGVPRGTRCFFPEAPLTIPGFDDGRAWWMPSDLAARDRAYVSGEARDLSAEVPRGLADARDHVIALLGDLERAVRPPKVVLGGFSQGAMLSCDVALETTLPLAALVLLSGSFLAEEQWRPRMPGRRGLPAFLSHGDADRMLPFAQSERLRDALTGAGLAVTWVPFRGGHEIPTRVLDALGPFLRGALAGSGEGLNAG